MSGHFESHGNEFEEITKEIYQKKAAGLLSQPVSEGVLGYDTKTRRVRYNRKKNTIAIEKKNRDGKFKVTTMF